MNLTAHELLWTKAGREWLRKWCDLTRMVGDAAKWRELLANAETKVSDENLPITRATEGELDGLAPD